jgi:hypothetical protein
MTRYKIISATYITRGKNEKYNDLIKYFKYNKKYIEYS